MAANKLQWRRIAKGDELPCQSFLRKKDGEILKLSTIGGVTVGQDCYYLPVDEVINVIKDYPVEESEDERIRKEIIDFVKSRGGFKGDWIAWLEKQGEHANFRNKIQIGDKVTRNEDGVLVNLSQLNRVAKKYEKQGEQKPYGLREECKDCQCNYAGECKGSCAMKRGEQKPFDVEEPNFFDDFRKTDSEVEQKPAWSEEDIKTIERIVCILDGMRYYNIVDNKQEKPYQSEIDWLKSFKDKVQPQPKQEWSEEDEKKINELIELCKGRKKLCSSTVISYKRMDVLQDWLKSLRPQSQWRPSETDIRIFEQVIDGTANPISYSATLHVILEQLKKLREE